MVLFVFFLYFWNRVGGFLSYPTHPHSPFEPPLGLVFFFFYLDAREYFRDGLPLWCPFCFAFFFVKISRCCVSVCHPLPPPPSQIQPEKKRVGFVFFFFFCFLWLSPNFQTTFWKGDDSRELTSCPSHGNIIHYLLVLLFRWFYVIEIICLKFGSDLLVKVFIWLDWNAKESLFSIFHWSTK